jgi:hypothetical protein
MVVSFDARIPDDEGPETIASRSRPPWGSNKGQEPYTSAAPRNRAEGLQGLGKGPLAKGESAKSPSVEELHQMKAVETKKGQPRALDKAAKFVLGFLGLGIVALVVGFIQTGIGQSGVMDVGITHVMFWLAFIIATLVAPLAVWVVSHSWKYSVAALVSAVIFVGGGLLWLNGWLTAKKALQDAVNQSPPILHTSAPSPNVPMVKPSKHKPQEPRINIEQHGEGAGAVGGSITTGPCSNVQVGGSNNQGTVNCAPPARRVPISKQRHLIALASEVKANVSIGCPSGSVEACRFAQDVYDILNAAHWTMNGNSVQYGIMAGPPITFLVKLHGSSSESGVEVRRPEPAWYIAQIASAAGVTIDVLRTPDVQEGYIAILVGSTQ